MIMWHKDSRTFGRGRWLCSALLASAASIVMAAPAHAQDVAAADEQPADAGEDIVVTGIRSSLQSALGEKRNADNLVEVIQAEDIGQLPDQNLAEVLENVTGIQITRSASVGAAVQIRGTDANRTEINGVSTVSSGSSRSGISFEDLPAALIASVEVTKVPAAATIEGSVGGTINLRTIRPLSLNEPLISARAQIERSDLSGSTLPRLSATVGNSWDTAIGEIGFVMSGSYARQDVASFSPRVDRDAVVLPGSGPSARAFPFLRIQFFDQELINYEYDTRNFTGALEWRPDPGLRLYFDVTVNNQRRTQESTRVQISGTAAGSVVNATNNTSFETVDWGNLDGPDGPIDLGTVQAALTGTIGFGVEGNGTIDPNLRTSSNTGARLTRSRVWAFGTEWNANEELTIRAEGSLSTSVSAFPNFSTTLDFINPLGPQPSFGRSLDNGVPTEFDLRGGTLQFGLDSASPFAPTSAMLLNPANYRLQQVTQGANATDNEELAGRIDVSYDTSGVVGFLRSVDVGYRWNRTSAVNNVFTNNVSLTNPTTHWNRPGGSRFSSILTPGPDNFDAADNRRLFFPDFLIIDPALSFSDSGAVLAALNSAIAGANADRTVGAAIAALAVPTESAAGFFTIEETTNAAYFQANFETDLGGVGVRGNAGVRWVNTRISSIGNNVSNNTSAGQIVANSSYSLWLPRFNLVIEPANRVLIRGGIARDIRRPDFNQLSTSVSFGTSPNTPVNVGNPNLLPETVWSFDLSAEYYFAPSSLISIGVFHKSRTNLFAQRQEDPAPNLIGSQLNVDITPPCEQGGIYNPIAQRGINNPTPGSGICVPLSSTFNVGGSTTQTGIEIAFQHDLSAYEETLGFASGFGFIGNLTYQTTGGSAREFRAVDGPRNVFTLLGYPNSRDRIGLTNLSRLAYNATLFYDKHGLNARLRYTWRSSYATDDSFFFGLPRINGDRGQLNASINYDITDNINVGIEGINLLRSDQNQFCVNNNALLCFQGLTDRRVTAGLSVRF